MDTKSEVRAAHEILVDYWAINSEFTKNWTEVSIEDSQDSNPGVICVWIPFGEKEAETDRKTDIMRHAGIAGLVSDIKFIHIEAEPPVLL